LVVEGAGTIGVHTHTDRPPDIACNAVNVFAGCSQERANTRRIRQLASFARGSHCSSGNVSSLAANAILGKSRHQAIYCVRAVGTSHEVNRGLSWTLPRCGRFRVNGIRVWLYAALLQTWVVIFFLRGGFLTTPDSAGSMAQHDNRHVGT
jgi:hypothetical protein